MARPVIVVKIKGKTRKVDSLSDKIRAKIWNKELVVRTGVKIGNKITWIGDTR